MVRRRVALVFVFRCSRFRFIFRALPASPAVVYTLSNNMIVVNILSHVIIDDLRYRISKDFRIYYGLFLPFFRLW